MRRLLALKPARVQPLLPSVTVHRDGSVTVADNGSLTVVRLTFDTGIR